MRKSRLTLCCFVFAVVVIQGYISLCRSKGILALFLFVAVCCTNHIRLVIYGRKYYFFTNLLFFMAMLRNFTNFIFLKIRSEWDGEQIKKKRITKASSNRSIKDITTSLKIKKGILFIPNHESCKLLFLFCLCVNFFFHFLVFFLDSKHNIT